MFKIKGTYAYLTALFLNAFTDLGHKIIIQNTVFKMYDDQMQIVLTAIVNSLILLPFILVFTPAGFLADKFPKNKVMTFAAALAVVLTLCITLSYYMGWFEVAFALTFLLATQSAIYSPAKYGYIKELVGNRYISAGNAAVQATTMVAIMAGMGVFSFLFESMLDEYHSADEILRQIAPLGWLLVLNSLGELYLISRLPNRQRVPSERKFYFKKYITGRYLSRNMKTITRKPTIFQAILALSIYWGVSQVAIAVFPEYAKSVLHINNTVYVNGVLGLTIIGIIIGSIAAARFSRYFIHMGLVPFSALGMAITLLLIPAFERLEPIVVLFFFFGLFSGMFIVPLNAFIQKHAPGVHLGTILAGNNFIQNIFMIVLLGLTTYLAYYEGFDAAMLFYAVGVLTLVMAVRMTQKYALEQAWFISDMLLSLRYKMEFVGVENVPHTGAVLMTPNHISWLDWVIAPLAIEREKTFMMERSIYHWPIAHHFFKWGRAIPVSSKAAKDAFKQVRERLRHGEMVTLFPEGGINRKEELQRFLRGYELAVKGIDGVIIPVYIGGMWGSFFSRAPKHMTPRRTLFRRKVTVIYGQPLPMETTADELREAVQRLKEQYDAQ